MIITNVEAKSASNGNTYKQVTLAEKAYGKDRTNVFSNHPLFSALQPGYDIPLDQLEINQKGYLELKGGVMKKSQAQAEHFDNERIMRIEAMMQNVNKKVNDLWKHAGFDLTPEYPTPEQEGIDITRSGMVNDDINPEDIPFN